MIQKKLKLITYELSYYTGSLDYPCNFRDSNSYRNFHIKINDNFIVICEKCLKKAKKEK